MPLITKDDVLRNAPALPRIPEYHWLPDLELAEQELAVPLLGPAYWQQLKTEQAAGQFTAASLALMQLLTPALAYWTAAIALPTLVLLQPENERWNAQILQQQRLHYQSRARLCCLRIRELLRAQAQNYPLAQPLEGLLGGHFPVFIPK